MIVFFLFLVLRVGEDISVNEITILSVFPELSFLEIDLVKYIYTKYQNELSKEDEFRNRLCDDYVFN
jgi:hypothetical protein